jgi:sporulation protein YlmC with PRC-barrel domain
MRASTLKDKPVVSMADGAQVGTVEDVLFDPAELRLMGLALRGQSGKSILPFDSIRSIGADAVMVESAAETQGAGGQAIQDTMRGLGEITSLSVVNAEGTLLGKVKEVEIDEDGRLAQLEAHRGGVLGIGGTDVTVPPSAIRSIGPKLITVDMPSESSKE